MGMDGMSGRVTFGASDPVLREKTEPEDQRQIDGLAGGGENAEVARAGKGKINPASMAATAGPAASSTR